DTVGPPETLRTLVSFLDTRPDTAAVTCRELGSNGRIHENCWTFLTPWIEILKRTRLQRLFGTRLGKHRMVAELDKVRQVDAATGCFLMLRTACFRDLGGFDEEQIGR